MSVDPGVNLPNGYVVNVTCGKARCKFQLKTYEYHRDAVTESSSSEDDDSSSRRSTTDEPNSPTQNSNGAITIQKQLPGGPRVSIFIMSC